MAILSLLLAGLVVYYASWVVYARWFHPYSKYPGPFLASISRFWAARGMANGTHDKSLKKLHDMYGPIIRIAPDEVDILDPSAIKTVYGAGTKFVKTDFYMAWHAPWARHPEHFCATDPATHGARRKLVSHIYSMTNISRFEQGIDNCTSLMLSRFRQLASSSSSSSSSSGAEVTVDLSVWLRWYAFDVVGELFFARHFGFLEKSEDHGGWIGATDLLVPYLAISSVLAPWMRPLLMIAGISLPWVRKGARAVATIEKVCDECIGAREKERKLEEKGSASGKDDLLSMFFRVVEATGDPDWFGPLEVKGEIYAAIGAGSDTTAIAMTSILYHLLKNPTAYRKLRDEIDAATRAGELSEPFIRYNEASKLRYLDAVCKEGMRIHASIGYGLPRHVPPQGAHIAGEWFPGGYRVAVSPYLIQHDKSVFGEDADRFRPERWLGNDAANMDRHMLEFGAGAHLCLGKNISLSEIYKIIPELIRAFDLELVEPEQDWTTKNIWFYKIENVNVRIKPREKQR